MQPFYFLSFFSSGLKTKFSINHFSVVSEEVGYESSTTQVVNRWLGQCNNHFKLDIDVADYQKMQAESDQNSPPEQIIRIKIFEGKQTDSGMIVNEVIWEYNYPGDERTAIVMHKTVETVNKINLPYLPIFRLWQFSQNMEKLSQQDHYDILTALKNIRIGFAQQQYEKVFEYFRYRYEDEEISEHMGKGTLAISVLDMWKTYLPKMKMNQYPIENVSLKLLDNHIAVQVEVSNEEYPIAFSDEKQDLHFGIPLYFCKMNDHWLVIR